jgi:hypothetical protein
MNVDATVIMDNHKLIVNDERESYRVTKIIRVLY